MKLSVLRLLALISLIVAVSVSSFAQTSAAGSISGVVKDPNGAVVVGATINVKNPGTGQEFSATTSDNGTFTIPAVSAGKYTVTIKAQGFKTAVVKDVEVLAATPANVDIALQVGAQNEEIQVTGAGEVLQTQSANVSNTITGRQITDLPFASRNALDLVLFMPGVSTPSRPRSSSVNGLPKGALNITMDGINVQDNLLKSSDGFFTYIQPRTDAVEEVTVSTATPGAESAGEGAVQIKFVTRSGSNKFTGSVYEYLRNPSLNSNYYFNKLVPIDQKPTARARVILNQFGFRLGGPIVKDKFFFFVNYEEYRLPEQTVRTRSILTTQAASGIYKYNFIDPVDHTAKVGSVDLLAFAASKGLTVTTADPTISKLYAQILGTTSQGSVASTADPNLNNFTFTNTGGQIRKFPTVRFDYQVTSKHHIENTYNYQYNLSKVDFLNNVDSPYPGLPAGSQVSNRFSDSIALRSTLTPTIVNEFRFGLTGGTVVFDPEITPASYGYMNGASLGITAAGFSSATTTNAPQSRNTPTWQFSDNLSWSKGNHSINFGYSFTQINSYSLFPNFGIVPAVAFGFSSTDAANNAFQPQSTDPTKPFYGASTSNTAQAQAIYATLIGAISSISGGAVIDETNNNYKYLGNLIQRSHHREMGVFAQDTWRYRPNLTLTGGIRWEPTFPFIAGNQSFAQLPFAQVFGISGEGNLFKPGTLTGTTPAITGFGPDNQSFNRDLSNFAPSIGFAWSPNLKGNLMKKLFGDSGQTVMRGGYSVSFVREGVENIGYSILGSNPGPGFSTLLQVDNNLANGQLLRNGIATPTIPTSPSYPLTPQISDSVNVFNPKLQTGYVNSWTLSLQREINKDTVIEARYVGTRGVKLWRQYNIDELNVVENGFVNEFKQAQANFLANVAYRAANPGDNTTPNLPANGRTFAFTGVPGTAPLPTILGFFSGNVPAGSTASYNSANFASSTFFNLLKPEAPNVLSFASTLYNNATRRTNATAANIAPNFFYVNPTVFQGGAFLVDNSNRSWYDAAVVELRRRLAHGLLFQGSYTFSKAMANAYANSQVVASNFRSLHNPGADKSLSPFDLTHAFKANFIYELPFGKGQRFLDSSNGIINHLIGGWSMDGTARIQSGSTINFGAVQLVGMTQQELEKSLQVRHGVNVDTTGKPILDAAGNQVPVVYYLPQDIIDNTRRAFNTGFAAIGTAPSLGNPAAGARFIAPANYGTILPFTGASGFPFLIVHGPRFSRFDLSAVKKTKITEGINVEFRAEFLNAFNNINFKVGSQTNEISSITPGGATFGQTGVAYQDTSTTNDPGGRLIQFVLRINF